MNLVETERIEELRKLIFSKDGTGLIYNKDTTLATVNIDVISKVIYDNEKSLFGKKQDKPLLGLATTRELLAEITARIEVDGQLDYKTVGEK